MQYPLTEKIGQPDLLVGRQKEFQNFGKWLANIPKKLSKSRVILARRKSGKTTFVQRLFNQLWSENGMVIPFYFDMGENKVWYPDLAIDYYCTFASQYISFLERNEKWVRKLLSLEQIREYGVKHSIEEFVEDVDFLLQNKTVGGSHSLMWKKAYSAPHRFADLYDRRFLVILDEFQNITRFIYRDEKCEGNPDETLAGSFHYYSESKIAPMLVTGSYVGWLLRVISQYLEAGRLKPIRMSPYLTFDEGLEAVYKYAAYYQEPITNETAFQINELCLSDPFFISCVIQSEYENKDLETQQGVIETVNYEISAPTSEMFLTWGEYIDKTLNDLNDRNAKRMLLYLSQHAERYWKPAELKEAIPLDLEISEIHHQLKILVVSDLINRGASDIEFRGLQDGTLNLIVRNRFEEELYDVKPNLTQEFQEKIEALTQKTRSLQGSLNYYAGLYAEYLLATAFRSHPRLVLTQFFPDASETSELNLSNVKERVPIQRDDGKILNLDVVAESACGRTVLVEVKKRQTKTGLKMVEDFQEKVEIYAKRFPEQQLLSAFLSLGDFTEEAKTYCEAHGIATASQLAGF